MTLVSEPGTSDNYSLAPGESTTYTWTFTAPTGPASGSITLSATVTSVDPSRDLNPNSPVNDKLSDSESYNWNVLAPSVEALSITAPPDITTVEGNTEGGATGVALGTPSVSGGTPPYTITNDAPDVLPLGTTTVTWTATDASSNSTTATQSVTVEDTTSPVITPPSDITVEGNTTGGFTKASLTAPIVSDIVDSDPAVTNDAPDVLPLGTTTVTWTATDASSNSATATQNVTVEDTTSPVITAAISISTTVGAPKSILLTPTVSDIVDPDPIVTNDAPDFFPPGKTIVIWTATDASSNSATATTTVTATYLFGGILQPINADGSSIFKFGSTIPVKFQLTDYNGNFVTTAVATIRVAQISGGIVGTDTEAISTNTPATTGNLFRLADSQYIFNLATKPLLAGTWQIQITLDDGTLQTVMISLKK